MKKAMKTILAIMLVAMFAFTMIPTAFADGGEEPVQQINTSLKIKNDNADFAFDVYQIATISEADLATGKYTFPDGLAAAAKTAVNTANQTGAQFLAALDAIQNLGIDPVVTLSGKENTDTKTYAQEYETDTKGIYYARVSEQPSGNVAKVSNSVIVWPEYKSGSWDDSALTVDLATKVGTDRIHKNFSDTTAEYKEAEEGQTISFTLKADIVGSENDLATKYEIWDKMCPGLQYVAKSAHIFYDGTTTSADADFVTYGEGAAAEKAEIKTNVTDADTKYNKGTTFSFRAKADVLSDESSEYYKHSEVYITYDAVVLNTAGIGADYNPNKDGLVYRLASSTGDVTRDGNEVKVYTYAAQAVKIDASATAKATDGKQVALKGAVIGLYTKDATSNALTEIARGESDENGLVIFTEGGDKTKNALRLAPGSYVVKEISAPEGYALSTVEYPLTVTADHNGDGIFNLDDSKVIENFATKLPETGGQGTLMFTLIGAGLILCAGVLFVIIMKKKSAK